MTVRHAGPQALAAERSSVPPGHVRGGPGLVDEDEARGVEIELVVEPLLTSPQDVQPLLLGRVTRDETHMALPREPPVSRDINHLAEGLGEKPLTDRHSVSGRSPKP